MILSLIRHSAGGNLALALLQLLMQLRRHHAPILWHGETREVPLPAGVAVLSPWLDLTLSSPTWRLDTPTPYDWLPKPEALAKVRVPPCDIWPASPRRKRMYVVDALASHPLVSPVTAPSWEGAPPVYVCAGWEILADEAKFLARKLESDGVRVVFEEYEAMPHSFALVLCDAPSTKRCFDAWAGFARTVVKDPGCIVTSATAIKARTLEEVPLKFDELSDITEGEMRRRVSLAATARVPVWMSKL